MTPETHLRGELVMFHLRTASNRLGRIPEEMRQRLSHESRLELDNAELDLRHAIRVLDTTE